LEGLGGSDTYSFSAGDGHRFAARFVIAARGIGLARESKITGAILSNPVTAMPLAGC